MPICRNSVGGITVSTLPTITTTLEKHIPQQKNCLIFVVAVSINATDVFCNYLPKVTVA